MGLFKKKKDHQTEVKSVELYDETELEELESYITNTFGEMENVFHEVYSPDIHVDIAIIPPNEHDHFYKLITMGMGAHDMNVPSEIAEYELSNAELMIYLPCDWDIYQNNQNENNYWPIRWLKILARMPINYDTWLGHGHTISAGNDHETLSENNQFESIALVEASDRDGEIACCRLSTGKLIRFYQLLPLYDEELQLKVQYESIDALLEKFDDDFSNVVDIHRKHYLK